MRISSATPTLSRTINQTTESTSEIKEQIRLRAYKLFEERGGNDGHEIDDWLQAESEVTRQAVNKIAA